LAGLTRLLHLTALACLLWPALFPRTAGAVPPLLSGAGAGRAPVLFPARDGQLPVVMRNHRVLIELYPGRALFRHRCLLFNPGETVRRLDMGLPRSGSFRHPVVSRVSLDTLLGLEVRFRGLPAAVSGMTDTFSGPGLKQAIPDSYRDSVSSWYLWQVECPPGPECQLEISYAVKTGPAILARGINVRSGFFLAALLEQPRGWGGPLDSLLVRIRLGGGLDYSDLVGLYPDGFIRGGPGEACFQISGRSPSHYDNLLIGIRPHPEGGPFRLPADKEWPGSCPSGGEKLPAGDFDVFPAKEYLALGVLAASLALAVGIVYYLNSRR
jgi:hypothetical protein